MTKQVQRKIVFGLAALVMLGAATGHAMAGWKETINATIIWRFFRRIRQTNKSYDD